MCGTMERLKSPVQVGELVAGKYRVERVLGEGGMGIVVAARHITLDHLVAVKLMHAGADADDDLFDRFLREARAASKLQSEHIARVIDFGKLEGGEPYMIMEYLAGSDLGAILGKAGRLGVAEAVDYV